MSSRPSFRGICQLSLLVISVAVSGCGGTAEIAEVEGVLLINGKPGDAVAIQFIPDSDKGTTGPMSTAETDSEGRFKLQLFDVKTGSGKPGAVVGAHRVVLSDKRLAESSTGRGVPIRFNSEYTLVGSTPLTWEVHAGKQSIELKVPPKP